MAVEYARVLSALGRAAQVIGRGSGSAEKFEKSIGLPVKRGGVEALSDSERKTLALLPAIVATSERQLGRAVLSLLEMGTEQILVEKPGAFDVREIDLIRAKAEQRGARVLVGYNRRFFASVQRAREMIQEDGGVSSFLFEFTEWSHRIRDLPKEEGVLPGWLLHNSSHVMDLAFHLGGKPKDLSCHVAGGLSWHPSGSVYAGSGATEGGALFCYHANWEAPGRWGVEILTRKRRLIFRPLEILQVQEIGSTEIRGIEIDNRYDTQFKPGLYLQTMAFLNGDLTLLPSIAEQAESARLYQRIAGLPG
jgi:predicted dehydrogenase